MYPGLKLLREWDFDDPRSYVFEVRTPRWVLYHVLLVLRAASPKTYATVDLRMEVLSFLTPCRFWQLQTAILAAVLSDGNAWVLDDVSIVSRRSRGV